MAKRFTDTKKWDDDWYLDLPPRMKCVWANLLDNCDGAGLIKVSFSKLTFMIKEPIMREEFDHFFSERVHWYSEDSVWIHGYIKAQYKELTFRNKAHVNIARLALRTIEGQELSAKAKKVADLLITLVQQSSDLNPTLGDPPADPQAGDIGNRIKEIGNRKELGGVGEIEASAFDFESLYAKYPLKEGRTAGLAQCQKQIKTQADFDALSSAIDRYAAKRTKDRLAFKMFSSFLGSDRTGHPWRDWTDPAAGTLIKPPDPPRRPPSEPIPFNPAAKEVAAKFAHLARAPASKRYA